jgi:uncharacterized membrane protein
MDRYRVAWTRYMLTRDVRIVDTQIMTSLQNGTAFFASTALFAIGGALALLRSTDEVMAIFAALPFASKPTATVWEVKTLGLLVIFAYTFFKFAWSYRLFNYAAILLGATPERPAAKSKEARAAATRVAAMTTLAGRHFNRGQRAFFLALGYLGWFINAYALAAATAVVVLVLLNRQLGTAAQRALPD